MTIVFMIMQYYTRSVPLSISLSHSLLLHPLLPPTPQRMYRIETMYRSLEILRNLPGHEERKETCESLSSALLSALRPRVLKDIILLNLDLSPLHEYSYVYQKLGR